MVQLVRIGSLMGAGRGAGRLAPLYTGQVATGCRLPNTFSGVVRKLMSRSPHTARDNITSLQIVTAGWYWNSGTTSEVVIPNTIDFTASIEYPAGTFTQVTWNGGSTSNTQNGNIEEISDAISVTIPNGDRFWVRMFLDGGASGFVYYTGVQSSVWGVCDNVNGAAVDAGAGASDQTMSGTVTPTTAGQNAATLTPLAIVAQTRKPSIAVLNADSIPWGYGDLYDSTGDLGYISRAVGPSFGYINLAGPSDRAERFAAGSVRRRRVAAAYCSHYIGNNCINDLSLGRTSAQIQGYFATCWTLMGSVPIYHCVPPSSTSSTDSWKTLANQTLFAAGTEWASLCTYLRGVPSPLAGAFDVQPLAQDTDKWKVNNTNFWMTVDGVHPSQTGHIALSGGINPAVITR